MKVLRYFAILLGVSIDLFVAIMILGALAGGKFWADIWIVLFFLGCGAFGGYLVTSNYKRIKFDAYKLKEKEILHLIKKLGGRVSAIEIAAESDMSVKGADNFLRQLCINGYGEEQIGANDSVVYVFDGFLSDEERKSSTRLLDFK